MNGDDQTRPQPRQSQKPAPDERPLSTPRAELRPDESAPAAVGASPLRTSSAPVDRGAREGHEKRGRRQKRDGHDDREEQKGPRFWALPDDNLNWWILREDDTGNAVGLTQGTPIIAIPTLSTERKATVGERCREFVAGRLRDRWHEDLFQLIKRLMLGCIFTLGGLITMRFMEYFDIPLLLCAVGYSAYAAIRYGGRFLRSIEAAANRPFSTFVGEPFVVSPLADKISNALEYRRSLPPEKRGEYPDLELLDANAYRALIRDGSVSRDELCALGRAVQQRLDVSLQTPKTLSDLSRAEGLDPESAALYRDLALAAAEIAYDSEFN